MNEQLRKDDSITFLTGSELLLENKELTYSQALDVVNMPDLINLTSRAAFTFTTTATAPSTAASTVTTGHNTRHHSRQRYIHPVLFLVPRTVALTREH